MNNNIFESNNIFDPSLVRPVFIENNTMMFLNQIIDIKLVTQLANYLCFSFIAVFKIILYIVFLLLIVIKNLLVYCFGIYKYEYLLKSLCAVFLFIII